MPLPRISHIDVVSRGATTVLDLSITTIVTPAKPRVVEVIQRGLTGPPGGTRLRFERTYSATTTVIVAHNLGVYPEVEVLSVGGQKLLVQVAHQTVNLLHVIFNTAQACTVICLA